MRIDARSFRGESVTTFCTVLDLLIALNLDFFAGVTIKFWSCQKFSVPASISKLNPISLIHPLKSPQKAFTLMLLAVLLGLDSRSFLSHIDNLFLFQ